MRAKCCTTADARKIPRDIHEDARDIARQKMKTKAFAKSLDERKRVDFRHRGPYAHWAGFTYLPNSSSPEAADKGAFFGQLLQKQ
jgi:hypothetical protein